MSKKIIWIIVLIAIVTVVGVVLCTIEPQDKTEKTTNQVGNKKTNNTTKNSIISKNKTNTIVTKQDDGTLYSLSSENESADLIIGDNYFDTQITDILMNPNNYKNKKIEIEGMYLINELYTFVGRYSTSSLCPTCPAGYSFMEYQWDGEKIALEDEKSWIKVIGTLEVGNDETSDYQDYYYLKALSIKVMNERGIDTVNN